MPVGCLVARDNTRPSRIVSHRWCRRFQRHRGGRRYHLNIFSYGSESTVPRTPAGHNPILAFKFDATPIRICGDAGHFIGRTDPLAGQGIVADDEDEDSDREKWVNEPTKCRRYDIEQDADSRP
jgi:hypothetical protein